MQNNFDYYWNIKGDFVEKLNRRRKGWSGVIISQGENSAHNNDPARICVKKQENYVSYSFFHFIRGTLTIVNEVRNLIYCRRHGINTPEIIYFEKRTISGKRQAILVTRFLGNFIPLSEIIYRDQNKLYSDIKIRRAMISKIASELQKLHKTHMMHNHLYPKHIFINPENSEICFIDLEKSRKRILSKSCTFRDLDVLNRYTQPVSKSDKLRFLKNYYNETVVTSEIRKIWRKLAKNSND